MEEERGRGEGRGSGGMGEGGEAGAEGWSSWQENFTWKDKPVLNIRTSTNSKY